MRWFSFVLSVRFWVFGWIAILFVGLTPLSPVAELLIVVGCVAHGVWFVRHRLRAVMVSRADARAEADELRRRHSSRGFRGDLPHPLFEAAPADPTHHSELLR
jgi:hypothetical protein